MSNILSMNIIEVWIISIAYNSIIIIIDKNYAALFIVSLFPNRERERSF